MKILHPSMFSFFMEGKKLSYSLNLESLILLVQLKCNGDHIFVVNLVFAKIV
jgi:hypothetical protein